jgi:hypothetical protein
MRSIKELLFAAPAAEGTAMDLLEGPEGLFPNLPERAFNQDSFALLSTLVDGVDHHTALDRLQPLRETPEGSAPKALLFEIPSDTRGPSFRAHRYTTDRDRLSVARARS